MEGGLLGGVETGATSDLVPAAYLTTGEGVAG
jgi:hypothetical protein